MIVRMSKALRPYVLKSEREGFYAKEIKKVEEEISNLKDDIDGKEKQKKLDIIEELKKREKTAVAHLKKYGPAVFHIKSADKQKLALAKAKLKVTIANVKTADAGDVTAAQLAAGEYMAIETVKLGLDHVDNLIDIDSPEDEKGNKVSITVSDIDVLISILPMEVIYELSGEISGGVSEEEVANLS